MYDLKPSNVYSPISNSNKFPLIFYFLSLIIVNFGCAKVEEVIDAAKSGKFAFPGNKPTTSKPISQPAIENSASAVVEMNSTSFKMTDVQVLSNDAFSGAKIEGAQ